MAEKRKLTKEDLMSALIALTGLFFLLVAIIFAIIVIIITKGL